ncbi:MAG: LysR family transcriptional regulator, partial [Chloroflexota bacterium]
MLSLHQLQIFHTAAESATLTAAAEKLYLTQPAVSQQIRNLETHLGTKLFERSRRGIELTPAGRELLTYTTQILRLVALAEASLTNINKIADVQAVVGATPNVGSYLLPQWVQSFRLQHPNITLIIQTDTTSGIIAAVSAGEQLLGFIEGEPDVQQQAGIEELVLEPLPHRVIIGREHPWWGRESVSVAELDRQPFIMRQKKSRSHEWLDEIFQRHSVAPRIVGEFDNPESLKQTVRNSTSIT